MQWLSGFETAPTMTYVVHGEEQAAAAVAQSIDDRLKWSVSVPDRGQQVVV